MDAPGVLTPVKSDSESLKALKQITKDIKIEVLDI